MKLAMFRVDTLVGPFDRFGIVTLDGDPQDTVENARDNLGSIVDVNFAYAAMEADNGEANPTALARFLPARPAGLCRALRY